MNITYLYQGDVVHGVKGDYRIRQAICNFVREENISTESLFNNKVTIMSEPEISLQLMQFEKELYFGNLGEIERAERGKPFLKNLPIEFSVTNCGDIWACTISDKKCGLDIQDDRKTKKDYLQLAERFYSSKELEYVKETGREGFFQIWVRKETFGKYTGQGFFGEMPEMAKDGCLLNKTEYGDKILNFKPLYPAVNSDKKIYALLCTEDSEAGEISDIEF